jgi:hypothetical protein
MSDKPTLPPQIALLQLISGYWVSQAIHVAARLGIADLLKAGPKHTDDLARSAQAHPHALYRLLRALASVGVFTEVGERTFRNTPMSDCLRGDVPNSQRSAAVSMGEEHYRAWGELAYSVQTGKIAFDKIFGKPIFQYLAENPRSAQLFDETMVGVHGMETALMLDAYDFSKFRTLVDVGGGNGSLLSLTLQRHPKLKAILFDRPDVIDRAKANLQSAGIADRCQGVGGNFFESAPAGGDAYLLRHIIHDWYDAESRAILGNIRKVIPPDGKLLIVESVIPAGNEPFFGKFLDLTMLVIPGGMERTEAEYRELLKSAGFALQRIVPTKGEVSVIEGTPA